MLIGIPLSKFGISIPLHADKPAALRLTFFAYYAGAFCGQTAYSADSMQHIRYTFTLLFLLAFLTAQAKVDTLAIQSPSMQKTLKASVVTPESYQKKKSGPYPVLYLLHGYGGNLSNWLKVPQKDLLQTMADKYQLIIVTPDGGNNWYYDSPTNKTSQYETFIMQELRQEVERRYRAIPGGTTPSAIPGGWQHERFP